MAFLMEMAYDELDANHEEMEQLWYRTVSRTGRMKIEEGTDEEFRWIP
jgi:hypothetical protein